MVKIAAEKHVLLFDMHHIISDGTSMGILVKEFTALYNGEELPELRIQYKDFSAWQNELFKTDRMKKQAEYWLSKFSGELPVLNMPTDYPRPSTQSFEGDRISVKASGKLSEKLEQLGGRNGNDTVYSALISI